jgi:hypothetical protein
MTSNPNFNYDIFLQRLRTNLGMLGRDRIMLIENRERIRRLRSEELEGPTDPFGQGGTQTPQPAASQNPDYSLYMRVSDMPNRTNRYYLFEFDLTNLRTRETIPLKPYEVLVRQ